MDNILWENIQKVLLYLCKESEADFLKFFSISLQILNIVWYKSRNNGTLGLKENNAEISHFFKSYAFNEIKYLETCDEIVIKTFL